MRTARRSLLLATVLVTATVDPALPCDEPRPEEERSSDKPAEGPRADEPRSLEFTSTGNLVDLYDSSNHWALKGVTLLGLGADWHPRGCDMILDALKDRDRRLRVFAVEALLRTHADSRASVLTKKVIDNLVNKQLRVKSEFYRGKVLEILASSVPAADRSDPAKVRRWWSRSKKNYEAPEWLPRFLRKRTEDGKRSSRTVVESLVDRVFEMSMSGIDVVICIDTTGSMQATINAARDGVNDIVAILRGISPRFRIGLVQYRDDKELKGDSAELLVPLTPSVAFVENALAKIVAGGGADVPEKVDRGLELALLGRVGWARSTIKSVIVVGDAPPHPGDIAATVKLVRSAKDDPFGEAWTEKSGAPTMGKGRGKSGKTKKRIVPFRTSCIGVGSQRIYPQTKEAFEKIAEAGGGSYGEILLGAGESNSNKIIETFLGATFGKGWEKETKAFAEIYLSYRDNRLIQ